MLVREGIMWGKRVLSYSRVSGPPTTLTSSNVVDTKEEEQIGVEIVKAWERLKVKSNRLISFDWILSTIIVAFILKF